MKNKIKLSLVLPIVALASTVVATSSIISCASQVNVDNSKTNTYVYVKFLSTDSKVTFEGPTMVRANVGDYFLSLNAPIAYKNGRPFSY